MYAINYCCALDIYIYINSQAIHLKNHGGHRSATDPPGRWRLLFSNTSFLSPLVRKNRSSCYIHKCAWFLVRHRDQYARFSLCNLLFSARSIPMSFSWLWYEPILWFTFKRLLMRWYLCGSNILYGYDSVDWCVRGSPFACPVLHSHWPPYLSYRCCSSPTIFRARINRSIDEGWSMTRSK